ncbi:MAG: tRNA (N6-isopentenyl adenosine(37)-C2)-methylthiotransferase MiaB [Bacteroidia bacterium]|nr:tRNA (N6-isopentenyl adenosine(37)-C2)-methylthiotransferase MiaB [Bacteroidia bacterium]
MFREGEKIIVESRQGEALDSFEGIVPGSKKLYLESYGCQMNFSDSEIVASIMNGIGYVPTTKMEEADAIFLNTCAIRDNAEQKIWNRLRELKAGKQKNPDLIVGVLGCMAERLKNELLEKEKLVDIVVGPDAYRDLPHLVASAGSGQKAVNVLLSREETYAEISPVRLGGNHISAFISIMRGCDNMCSFCVVPFTRGRERSRDPESIVAEATDLFNRGYREVTLLGQNVDSYLWWGGGPKKDLPEETVRGALGHQLDEPQQRQFTTFADLLEMVAVVDKNLRIRFSTSNPRDLTDAVLHAMTRHTNICKYIHLPVQSGNSRILRLMNRGYSREEYMQRITSIRSIIPDCGISTDIISGFCTETEEEHRETMNIMEWAGYDFAYMFNYSERPGTLAARQYADDVKGEDKSRRLKEIIEVQQRLSHESNLKDIGKEFEVLAESVSKRSDAHLSGRNSQNKVVIFPKGHYKPGDYVRIRIEKCTPATLLGSVVNGQTAGK